MKEDEAEVSRQEGDNNTVMIMLMVAMMLLLIMVLKVLATVMFILKTCVVDAGGEDARLATTGADFVQWSSEVVAFLVLSNSVLTRPTYSTTEVSFNSCVSSLATSGAWEKARVTSGKSQSKLAVGAPCFSMTVPALLD